METITITNDDDDDDDCDDDNDDCDRNVDVSKMHDTQKETITCNEDDENNNDDDEDDFFDKAFDTVQLPHDSTSTSSNNDFSLRKHKSVSFHTLPRNGIDVKATTGTATEVNMAVGDKKQRPSQRPSMKRTYNSVSRLDLSTGRVQHDNELPIREQHIQTIENIIPAGERHNRGSVLRRSIQLPRNSIFIQSSSFNNRLKRNSVVVNDSGNNDINDSTKFDSDVQQETNLDNDNKNNIKSNVHDKDKNAHSHHMHRHHYRIRSRIRRDQSFWHIQTEMMTQMISNYVTWAYRSSFYTTIITSYILFMGIMVLSAIAIYLIGMMDPHCIFVGPDGFSFHGHFMDAVHLSWTTLATVGYGLIGPTPTSDDRCFIINTFMAFEAFIGVLFGGFSSAIIIGKVARFQSIAHIHFADIVCVRFGMAAMVDVDEDNENEELVDESKITECNSHPFPILEFRMINLLSHERGGEILNASVKVLGSVLKNDCEVKQHVNSLKVKNPSPHLSSHPSMLVGMAAETTTQAMKKVGTVGTKVIMSGTKAAISTAKTTGGAAWTCARKLTTGSPGSALQQLVHQVQWNIKEIEETSTDEIKEADISNLEEKLKETLQKERELILNLQKPEIEEYFVDEGNGLLVPPRTYHKLQVETDRHPYFKRVWNIRHILNEESPILSDQARQLILSNNGQWPKQLSTAASIRQHVCFNDIIVTFGGTANASGNNVFAQKVYHFSDICIGYTFANVLTLSKNKVVVDKDLLNEVDEQIGGGAEPLFHDEADGDNVLLSAAKFIVNRKNLQQLYR